MRQVPQIHSYTLVGRGRLARHFQHYFKLLKLEFQCWNRHFSHAVPEADRTLLLISDSAIESFIQSRPELKNRRLVHCSGALHTPLAESVHPLMSFSHDLYPLETYLKVPLICEKEETALPDLPNARFVVPAQDRPYYHALCVLSGNFSILLWSKLFKELQSRWSIPPEAAHPYLEQITSNLRHQGAGALTGPLPRQDQKTIEANYQALESDAFQRVYEACVEAYYRERTEE